MFKVVVHRRAASYLKRLPRSQKERLKKALQELAHNPFKPRVKAMLGEWKGYYRLRVGDLRVIFWLDQEEQTIYIDYVGPRGDVYKANLKPLTGASLSQVGPRRPSGALLGYSPSHEKPFAPSPRRPAFALLLKPEIAPPRLFLLSRGRVPLLCKLLSRAPRLPHKGASLHQGESFCIRPKQSAKNLPSWAFRG